MAPLIRPTGPACPAIVCPGGVAGFEEVLTASLPEGIQKIAIACNDPRNLCTAVTAAEGSAETLFISSVDNEFELLRQYLDANLFDAIFTDSEAFARTIGATYGTRIIGPGDLNRCRSLRPGTRLTKWLIPTSGSSGEPKLVSHTLQSLQPERSKTGNLAATPEVWGLFYDLSRFAGLQVFLQSVARGYTLVVPDRRSSTTDQISFCAANGVSHISATPTLWRKLLMAPNVELLTLEQVTLGGEAADQVVLDRLKIAFPNARVSHVFASTETGVGFWTNDGLAGFPLSVLENVPTQPSVKIVDGRLTISSRGVASGYHLGESLGETGWVESGDLVEVRGDRFFVIGREGSIANVGGTKVNTDAVRSRLLGLPMVADAVVYGRPNALTGQILSTDIVLRPGVDKEDAREGLLRLVRETFSSPERPRQIRIVKELSVNSNGKPVRKS